MAYVTEVQGGLGKYFQPSPRNRSLMAIGIYKPGPNLPISRWNIVTNGDIVLQDARDARYSGYIAKATVPMITKFRKDMTAKNPDFNPYHEWVTWFLSDEGPFWRAIDFSFATSGDEVNKTAGKDTDTRQIDVLVKKWPKYKGTGFMYFQDKEYDILMTEEFQLKELLDKIQQYISEFLMQTKPPLTSWVPLGYAEVKFSDKSAPFVTEHGRPGARVAYSDKYVMEMSFPNLTNKIPDMAYYYFWLEILSHALQWIIHIDGYDESDYLALAWLIIYQANGLGTNTRPDEFPLNIDPIYDQILDNIGDDSNEAYTYRFAEPQEWRRYLGYCIIKAMAIASIDAEVHDIDYYLTLGDKLTAVESLRRIWQCDYETFGSESSPFFPPAVTYLTNTTWLPYPIDMKNGAIRCKWDRIAPVIGDKFTKIKVEHHEVMSAIFEPLDQTISFLEWDLSANDARRQEIMYRKEKLILYKFRIVGYTDALFGQAGRFQQFFLAQLTGTPTHFKRGYVTKPGLDIIQDPDLVATFPAYDRPPEITTIADSKAKGPSTLAPNAVAGPSIPPVSPATPEQHELIQPTPPPAESVTLGPTGPEAKKLLEAEQKKSEQKEENHG